MLGKPLPSSLRSTEHSKRDALRRIAGGGRGRSSSSAEDDDIKIGNPPSPLRQTVGHLAQTSEDAHGASPRIARTVSPGWN